jgi:hypothetical protein
MTSSRQLNEGSFLFLSGIYSDSVVCAYAGTVDRLTFGRLNLETAS